MEISLILFILTVFFIIGIIHFFRNNDELPLAIAAFNFLVLTRLYALDQGLAEWVSFNYGIMFEFDMDLANTVSQLIFLGTSVLFISYFIFYRKKDTKKKDNEEYLEEFLNKNKIIIIIGFVIFYVFKMVVGRSLEDTLGKGYAFLLTLATSSFIILLFLVVYKSNANFLQKLLYGVLFFIIAISTYSSNLRYQFLGWAIPIAVFLLKDFSPKRKFIYYSIGVFITFVFFSVAGAERQEGVRNSTFSETVKAGIQRIIIAEDVNFIDGFVMLYQVYPEYLDFHYGTDHLSIFIRPIPRAWWPSKPEGAWQQKYAQKYNLGDIFVTGISPTIYGVFYGEGGIPGIIMFSIIWAIIFNKIRSAIEDYDIDLQFMLKGIFLASLLPLLRSGDLPGDISIIGMSYWPIIVFVYQYNKFVKEKKEDQLFLDSLK